MLEIGTPVRVRRFGEIEPVDWYIQRNELAGDYYGIGSGALDDISGLGECVIADVDTEPEPFGGEFTTYDGVFAYRLKWPEDTDFDDWDAESYWFLENMLEVLISDEELPEEEPDSLFGNLFEVASC